MSDSKQRSSAHYVSEVIDNGGVSAPQILVICLCFLFNMLDGFDITAMAVVASSVAADLTFSADQIGWIFSFALAGMMVGAMLLAPASDIVGRRNIILLSIVIVGAAVLLTAMASSLFEFVALRFIAGIGAGAMLASQATLADEYSPSVYRTLSVAIVTSGYPAGAMMTSVVAGFVMPDYGWQGMFWFGGSLTLAMVVVAFLFIPESLKYLLERRPANALGRINRILTRMGKRTIDALPVAATEAKASGRGFASTLLKLVAPAHRATTLQLWTAFLLSFASLYFLMSWVPTMIEDAGFTIADGRQAFFVMNLGALFGIYTLGLLSTRIRLTYLIASFFVATAIAMTIYSQVASELSLLFVLLFIIGLVQQGGFTGLYSVAAKVYPTDVRSTGIGWAIGLGRIGAVIGPAIAGYLIVSGVSMSGNFLVFAVPMALSAVLVYRLHIR